MRSYVTDQSGGRLPAASRPFDLSPSGSFQSPQTAQNRIRLRRQPRHVGCVCAAALLSLIIPAERTAEARRAADTAPQMSLSRQYIQTVWTVEDGLPQNSVTAILQTRDGYLWLGTFGGLVRFDGLKFTVFNSGNSPGMKTNRILSLYEDRAGTLWIGTETGEVMQYSGGSLKSFSTADGLPGGLVWSFLESDSGFMWIGTSRGLVQWQGGSAKKTYTKGDGLAGDIVWSIYEDQPGHLWLGMDRGLAEFQNGRGVVRDIKPAMWGVPPGEQLGVRVVRPGADGNLWLGTVRGVARFVHKPIRGSPQIERLSSQYVRCLATDRAENIWVGDFYGGIVNRWKPGSSSHQPDIIDLRSGAVAAISTDDEGNIWFGSMGGGLIRLKKRRMNVYSTEEGLPGDNVQAITDDGADGIWATTDGGLVHLSAGEGPKPTVYTTKEGLPVNYIVALFRDLDGTLWIGHQFGLTRFKDGLFTTYSAAEGLSPGVIHAVVRDREGNLWVGGNGGLNKSQNGRFISYGTGQGMVSNDVRFILPARDGSLWLGTTGGLSHFSNDVFTNFRTEQGLSNNFVRTIVEEEDGTLWIGTYGGGLNRLKDGRLSQLTSKDGLFDDFISQIIADDFGRFWMLSNRGVFYVAAKELNDFADGRTRSITYISYGIADGMKSSEGNGGTQSSAWKAPDGRLWFATIKGLVSLMPQPSVGRPPRVIIEEVVADRKTLPIEQNVRIEPGIDNIEIHYTGLSLSRPEQVRFKYKLIGHDNDWVDAGTRRIAYYSRISPGEYPFYVIAASSDGVWNDAAATLAVVVVPPFWRTWWFLSLLALSAVGIMVAVYKRRVEHLKRAHAVQEAFSRQLLESQERERQRIAAELHDGLGQSLLIIKNRTFIASSANGNRELVQEQLEEIAASTSQAIDEVREIAYNLRPYQIERFGLTRTLRAIFTRFSGSSDTRFTAEIDPIDGLFSKENEINIYRIVQESLNNIVKHANATEASLAVKRESREVNLLIRDNGRGFQTADAVSTAVRPGGFGLTGMAERVRILGGSYLVESAPGRGTTITIRLRIADGAA